MSPKECNVCEAFRSKSSRWTWILTERAQRRSAAYCSLLIRAPPSCQINLRLSSQITLSTSQLFSQSCDTRTAFPAFLAAPGQSSIVGLPELRGRACCLCVRTPFENNPPKFQPTLDPRPASLHLRPQPRGQRSRLSSKHRASDPADDSRHSLILQRGNKV